MSDSLLTLQSLDDFLPILMYSPENIIIADERGAVLYANLAAQALLGYTAEQFNSLRIADLIPPGTRRKHAGLMRNFFTHPQVRPMKEREILSAYTADKREIPVQITLLPLQTAQGARVLAYLHDVSELEQRNLDLQRNLERLQQAQTEHEQVEQLYQSLLNQMQEGLFLVQDGLIQLTNPAMSALLGYTTDEMVGQPFGKFVYPADLNTVGEYYNRRMAGEAVPNEYEARLRRKDGSPVMVSFSNAFIVYRDKPATFGTVRDITLQKQAQQQLQASYELRSRQLEAAIDIAQQIADADDLNELLRRVVVLIKERFGYYHTQIFRYDPVQNAVLMVVGYGEVGERMLGQGHRVQLGRGVVGMAAQTGKSVLAADVTHDIDWFRNPNLPETQGELAVPIVYRGEILGILDVQSSQANALSQEDVLLLQGLCSQIAIAFHETQLRLSLNERIEELSALQRMTSREGWQAFQRSRRQRARGYAFRAGEVQPLEAAALPQEAESPAAPANSLQAAAPLEVRGETIGTLAVEFDAAHPLTEQEQAILQNISLQVAEALERARLFEEIQARAEQERLVRTITDKVRRAESSEAIMRVTLEELSRALQAQALARLGKQTQLRLVLPPENADAQENV
ncbi:MAG: hypothetical protein OHK0052_00210 [Anaerolineales bacterium]